MLYHYYSPASRISRCFAGLCGLSVGTIAWMQWGVPWGNRWGWWDWHPSWFATGFWILGVVMMVSIVLTEVTHDGWPSRHDWWHPKLK